MKYLYIPFVIIQLIVIAFLGIQIRNKKQVLGSVSMNPIHEDSIEYTDANNLSHFYEPKSNTTQTEENLMAIPQTPKDINSDSLNEPRDYMVEKPADTIRIITLGDSFTFGAYVKTEENWTERLEKKLTETPICKDKKVEVINLGVGGYDIQYAVERLKLRGLKYEPDLVIWFLKDDDFEQIHQLVYETEEKIRADLKKSGEYDKLIASGDYYPSWQRAFSSFQKEYREEKILKLQQTYLDQFNQTYKGKLLVITFPVTKSNYKSLMSKFLEARQNASYLELTGINKDKKLALPDGHPSSRGHTVISEDVYAYLTDNKSMLCD